MAYVDGYVAAVRAADKDDYIVHAKAAAIVFKDHGATRVVECWGDDVPNGEMTSFPMAVKKKEDEVVVFAWVEWPSKEAREAGMAKAIEDPRMQPDQNPMPLDGQRLIYGSFETIVDT